MINHESESTDVLIVGAGPSGLVSALLLARHGVRTIVLERNTQTDQHPKAHELNARSIEILRDVGIFDQDLAAEASPIEDASRIMFCRSINEELGRIDLLADPERKDKYYRHLQQVLPYLNLSQSEFEKLLVSRAEACPLIQVRFGHQWESLEQTEDGVQCKVATGSDRYTIASSYLLACDGASSRVRKAIGIEVDGPANIQSFVNAYFQLDLRDRIDTPAKLYWILHPKYAGTFVAHHVERRWVYAVPVFQPWEQPGDYSEEVMKRRIQGALGFDVPELEITSMSTWHMTAQIAQHFRQGRIFLVGDAAHRFPPTGGLGMNTGIADAHNLCWKLGFVLNGKATADLLDTYEQERKPVAEINCRESLQNYERIFDVLHVLGLSKNGLEVFARVMNSFPIKRSPDRIRQAFVHMATRIPDWLVRRGLKPGRVRDRVAAAINDQINHFDRLGLDIGYVYDEGAIIADSAEAACRPNNLVGDYVPTTAPGARLPHCWIEQSGSRFSSLDRIAYDRFSLFTSTPSDTNIQDVETVDTSKFGHDLFPSEQTLLVRPDGHVAWRDLENTAGVANVQNLLAAIDCVEST